jgi:hypothetical protein
MDVRDVSDARQRIETADTLILSRSSSTILALTGLHIENLRQINWQLLNVLTTCPQTIQSKLPLLSFPRRLQIYVQMSRLDCRS